MDVPLKKLSKIKKDVIVKEKNTSCTLKNAKNICDLDAGSI
ncbi:hypothetical protein [Apilactobacillus kunkeei]